MLCKFSQNAHQYCYCCSAVAGGSPSEEFLKFHVAVRLKDCIVLVSSSGGDDEQEIWTYNLWTSQWRERAILGGKQLPFTKNVRGVAIGTIIYMFGADNERAGTVLKLTNANGSFKLNRHHTKKRSKCPSPRHDHCSWEYGDKMWIFGGYGESPECYLNDHGDFVEDSAVSTSLGWNNQLLHFDPAIQAWENVACFGHVPPPQSLTSAAVIRDNVWLYAETADCGKRYGLYELNLPTLSWTLISVKFPKHMEFDQSITRITDNQILLLGGLQYRYSEIIDVEPFKPRMHDVFECNCHYGHTSSPGLNSDVITISRYICSEHTDPENPVVHVMLAPKSLQQLAMKIIYEEHEAEFLWERLPASLMRNMIGI